MSEDKSPEEKSSRLYELRDSGGEAWEEVKVGLDKAIEELKQTFNRARSKFKEK